jgi:hypothetical protein
MTPRERELSDQILKLTEERNTLRTALQDLLNVISADDLIPENVSYMRQARAAVTKAGR